MARVWRDDCRSVNKWIKAMMYAYDLNTLRKTMRQLEEEGKVKRKEVQP